MILRRDAVDWCQDPTTIHFNGIDIFYISWVFWLCSPSHEFIRPSSVAALATMLRFQKNDQCRLCPLSGHPRRGVDNPQHWEGRRVRKRVGHAFVAKNTPLAPRLIFIEVSCIKVGRFSSPNVPSVVSFLIMGRALYKDRWLCFVPPVLKSVLFIFCMILSSHLFLYFLLFREVNPNTNISMITALVTSAPTHPPTSMFLQTDPISSTTSRQHLLHACQI